MTDDKTDHERIILLEERNKVDSEKLSEIHCEICGDKDAEGLRTIVKRHEKRWKNHDSWVLWRTRSGMFVVFMAAVYGCRDLLVDFFTKK